MKAIQMGRAFLDPVSPDPRDFFSSMPTQAPAVREG